MKATLIALGILILLVSVIFFFSASSDLRQLDNTRDSFWGLGGVAQKAADALGVTNYDQQRNQAESKRNISVGGMIAGGLLFVVGLTIRHKST